MIDINNPCLSVDYTLCTIWEITNDWIRTPATSEIDDIIALQKIIKIIDNGGIRK